MVNGVWGELQHVLPLNILLRLAAVKCPKASFREDAIGWVGLGSILDQSYRLLQLTVQAGNSQKLVVPMSHQPAPSMSTTDVMWTTPPQFWFKMNTGGAQKEVDG
ncbi:hypothetical protein V6N13_083008 [Hibiscus sabdariffa]